MVNLENISASRWDKLLDDTLLNGEVEGKNENLLPVLPHIDWNYVVSKSTVIFQGNIAMATKKFWKKIVVDESV